MNFEVVFMLVLTAAALVVFIKELLPIEVTALGMVAILLASGILDLEEAISGFSSTAVIAIGGLLVLSHALTKTGLLESIADWVGDRAHSGPLVLRVFLLGAVAVGSGVLNNTAVVALAIPLVMKLCRRLDLSPSKLLLPISFASILGGTLTLIGTSTNLLVNSLMIDAGVEPLKIFEFSLFGSVLLAVGLVYLLWAAPRLLPATAASGALTQRYLGGGYLTELKVGQGSGLRGRRLIDERVNERFRVTVLEVIREPDETHLEDVATVILEEGDHLVVQGALEDILRFRRTLDLTLLPQARLDDTQLVGGGQVLVEAWIAPGSQLIGRTLRDVDFHHHYGAFVLAVRRIGATLRTRLGGVTLRLADALLVLAPPNRLERIEESGDLKILSEHDVHLRRQPRWWVILLVLPAVVGSAAIGLLDIAAAALIGSIVLLVLRVITPEEAYRAINWPVLFMIAAFVPVGRAFQITGTADYLAGGLLKLGQLLPPDWAPYLMLALVFLLTAALTQVASNSAAAIVVAPIALSLGPAMGVDSRPFVIAVCFAASAAFLTPMSYQTNLMVYAPGEYRFADFLRFGGPLSLLSLVLSVLLIPWFWPF